MYAADHGDGRTGSHWPDCNWCKSNSGSGKAPDPRQDDDTPSSGTDEDDNNDGESESEDDSGSDDRRRSLPNGGDSSQVFFEGPPSAKLSLQAPDITLEPHSSDDENSIVLGTTEDPYVDSEWGSLPWWNETKTDQDVEDDRRAGHGVNAWGNFRRPMKKRDDEPQDGEKEEKEHEKRASRATPKPTPTSKGKASCTPSTTYVAPTASESAIRLMRWMMEGRASDMLYLTIQPTACASTSSGMVK